MKELLKFINVYTSKNIEKKTNKKVISTNIFIPQSFHSILDVISFDEKYKITEDDLKANPEILKEYKNYRYNQDLEFITINNNKIKNQKKEINKLSLKDYAMDINNYMKKILTDTSDLYNNKYPYYLNYFAKNAVYMNNVKDSIIKGWNYRVYYDKYFDDLYYDKSLLNKLLDLYNIKNEKHILIIKDFINKFNYIKKEIINKKYRNIELISYEVKDKEDFLNLTENYSSDMAQVQFRKLTYKYYNNFSGFPNTFGSNIRLFVFEDRKVEYSIIMNSNFLLMTDIVNIGEKFINSKKELGFYTAGLRYLWKNEYLKKLVKFFINEKKLNLAEFSAENEKSLNILFDIIDDKKIRKDLNINNLENKLIRLCACFTIFANKNYEKTRKLIKDNMNMNELLYYLFKKNVYFAYNIDEFILSLNTFLYYTYYHKNKVWYFFEVNKHKYYHIYQKQIEGKIKENIFTFKYKEIFKRNTKIYRLFSKIEKINKFLYNMIDDFVDKSIDKIINKSLNYVLFKYIINNLYIIYSVLYNNDNKNISKILDNNNINIVDNIAKPDLLKHHKSNLDKYFEKKNNKVYFINQLDNYVLYYHMLNTLSNINFDINMINNDYNFYNKKNENYNKIIHIDGFNKNINFYMAFIYKLNNFYYLNDLIKKDIEELKKTIKSISYINILYKNFNDMKEYMKLLNKLYSNKIIYNNIDLDFIINNNQKSIIENIIKTNDPYSGNGGLIDINHNYSSGKVLTKIQII